MYQFILPQLCIRDPTTDSCQFLLWSICFKKWIFSQHFFSLIYSDITHFLMSSTLQISSLLNCLFIPLPNFSLQLLTFFLLFYGFSLCVLNTYASGTFIASHFQFFIPLLVNLVKFIYEFPVLFEIYKSFIKKREREISYLT